MISTENANTALKSDGLKRKKLKHDIFHDPPQRKYFGYLSPFATDEEITNFRNQETYNQPGAEETGDPNVTIEDCPEDYDNGNRPGLPGSQVLNMAAESESNMNSVPADTENPKSVNDRTEDSKKNTDQKSKSPKTRNRRNYRCKDPNNTTTFYDFCPRIVSAEDVLHRTHSAILEHLDHDTILPAKTQKEAYESDIYEEYKEAEEREIKALYKHGTFEHKICPVGRIPITCSYMGV